MAFVLIIMPAFGQSETKNNKIIADSKTAKADYLVAKALMKGFLIQLMNMLFYKRQPILLAQKNGFDTN